MAAPPGRHWRTDDDRDPLYRPAEISRWVMLSVPVIIVLVGAVLAVVSAAVGWAMLSVFVYSFAIVAVVALYVAFSAVWHRLRR